ncbi:6.8 kDa transmembrane protein [Cordyline virus 3]|uniref:6.8 kDa transmembrane protein n=1 Tax=Cordyline virus 3 TaxID=1177752 RepID=L7P0M9_9CLOS|nr:6.8 kDa transmembrane protein [Cordyline virus 3]AFJ05057.1 6.8 kDa transmembrane protein [Cordyline virus 3]
MNFILFCSFFLFLYTHLSSYQFYFVLSGFILFVYIFLNIPSLNHNYIVYKPIFRN